VATCRATLRISVKGFAPRARASSGFSARTRSATEGMATHHEQRAPDRSGHKHSRRVPVPDHEVNLRDAIGSHPLTECLSDHTSGSSKAVTTRSPVARRLASSKAKSSATRLPGDPSTPTGWNGTRGAQPAPLLTGSETCPATISHVSHWLRCADWCVLCSISPAAASRSW
jgi:hypothetical protein